MGKEKLLMKLLKKSLVDSTIMISLKYRLLGFGMKGSFNTTIKMVVGFLCFPMDKNLLVNG
jgi:hypothetical protein